MAAKMDFYRATHMQWGIKNHDFPQISCFISKLMQHTAIVAMEGEEKTASKLLNGTTLSDL